MINQELRRRIFEFQSVSILDIGCGLPFDYFCIFKEYKDKDSFFTYAGVDTKDEFEVYYNRPKEYLPDRFYFDSGDLMFLNFNNQLCPDDVFEQDIKIDKASFLNSFKFHFKTDIISFLSGLNNDESFNAIILSNVLHKLSEEESEKVFNKCLHHLKENSLIYVSVLAQDYPDPLPEDNLFSFDRFNKIKDKVNVDWSSEDLKSHFQFIGQLKK